MITIGQVRIAAKPEQLPDELALIISQRAEAHEDGHCNRCGRIRNATGSISHHQTCPLGEERIYRVAGEHRVSATFIGGVR